MYQGRNTSPAPAIPSSSSPAGLPFRLQNAQCQIIVSRSRIYLTRGNAIPTVFGRSLPTGLRQRLPVVAIYICFLPHVECIKLLQPIVPYLSLETFQWFVVAQIETNQTKDAKDLTGMRVVPKSETATVVTAEFWCVLPADSIQLGWMLQVLPPLWRQKMFWSFYVLVVRGWETSQFELRWCQCNGGTTLPCREQHVQAGGSDKESTCKVTQSMTFSTSFITWMSASVHSAFTSHMTDAGSFSSPQRREQNGAKLRMFG